MRFLCGLLPCLCLSALLQAQNSPCASCTTAQSNLSHKGHKVCLSDEELVAQIATPKPIGRPGLNEPHMNNHGTVVTCLCFSQAGKVTDISILSGPAIMRQSILESVKDWIFHPNKQGRHYQGGCGILRIHIDLNNSQINATIEK